MHHLSCRSIVLSCAALLACRGTTARAQTDGAFNLRDGDRVVFYGDSITAQALYTVYVESAVRIAHPDWNIRFDNAGVGGDRVDGGVAGKIDERLTRDVISRNPTVVTIMLGMNDRASAPTRAAYAAGYRHILDSLKKALPDARLTLIGPSPLDDVTRNVPGPTNADLVRMNTTLREFAREYKAEFIDFNAPGIAALQRLNAIDPLAAKLALPDRVHPEPGFHMLMAETLLRGWHFPRVVQTVEVNAATGQATGEAVTRKDGTLTWQSMDLATTDTFQPIDANEMINRQLDPLPHVGATLLHATGLAEGKYTLRIDDRVITEHVPSAAFGAGFDLSALPSPLHDHSKSVFYACSDSQAQQVMRMRLLSRSTDPAIAPHAAAGAEFLEGNIQLAAGRCKDAAARKRHTWALTRE